MDTRLSWRTMLIIAAVVSGCGEGTPADPAIEGLDADHSSLAVGDGLKADYFDSVDLTEHRLTRVDKKVSFGWGTGSPDPAIAPDTFSARWTGQVLAPTTGVYQFHTK